MQDIRDGIRRLTAQHESVSMINAAAASRLEPALSPDTDEFAWSWADGAVDPAATTHALVDGTIKNDGIGLGRRLKKSGRFSHNIG